MVSYNYTISPKLVNEFRFGFTNSLINRCLSDPRGHRRQPTRPDRHKLRQSPDHGSVSDLQFHRRNSGFTQIGHDKDGPGASKTLEFTDNFSRTMGKHTIRVGMDARRVFYETVVRWGQSDDFGAFTFNQGVFTGNAFGDFLLGLPNTSFIVESSPNTNEGAIHWGTYGPGSPGRQPASSP